MTLGVFINYLIETAFIWAANEIMCDVLTYPQDLKKSLQDKSKILATYAVLIDLCLTWTKYFWLYVALVLLHKLLSEHL